MSRFQLRDASDAVIAEESFPTFDEANVWSLEQDVEPGWTLFEQIAGQWTPARTDPVGA